MYFLIYYFQLVRKIQTQEATIESLSAQLVALETSDTLVRAKEQHEAIVSTLRQKHESEVLILKEHLDTANAKVEDRETQIIKLKQQLGSLVKNSENAHIDRADTINRLTRSLEDSQKQCQELLEAGQA